MTKTELIELLREQIDLIESLIGDCMSRNFHQEDTYQAMSEENEELRERLKRQYPDPWITRFSLIRECADRAQQSIPRLVINNDAEV